MLLIVIEGEGMKFITVLWVKETKFGYEKAMKVIHSNHPRFTEGSRFDFGFLSIASDEGYLINIIPGFSTNQTSE